MKILVGPLKIPSEMTLTYSRGQENPGLGGTDFLSLERAARLAESSAFDSVQVVVIGGTVSFKNPKLESVTVSNSSQFAPESGWVTISSVGNLENVPPENLRESRLVLLSHHPHDSALIRACESFKPSAVISVGKYPYWSVNSKISVPHFQIRDPFSPTTIASKETVTERYQGASVKVGHISSLHPAKGFLDIAKSWRTIHEEFPNMRLEVLGGVSLYDFAETHPSLPMERDYGDEVLQALGPAASSVDFCGVIGKGKDLITQQWHVAILNPRGTSEADPASFKDCMRAGVPVIGGDDFGLGDYMESFPNLSLKSPDNLVEVFRKTLEKPGELFFQAQAAISTAQKLALDDKHHWKIFEDLIARVGYQDSTGLAELARSNLPENLNTKKNLRIFMRNSGIRTR